MDRGANFDDCCVSDRGQPIIRSIQFKNLEITKLLISRGVDLECGASNSGRAIHYAIEHDLPEIVTLLVKAGVDLTCKNYAGKTPVQLAQEKNIKL